MVVIEQVIPTKNPERVQLVYAEVIPAVLQTEQLMKFGEAKKPRKVYQTVLAAKALEFGYTEGKQIPELQVITVKGKEPFYTKKDGTPQKPFVNSKGESAYYQNQLALV